VGSLLDELGTEGGKGTAAAQSAFVRRVLGSFGSLGVVGGFVVSAHLWSGNPPASTPAMDSPIPTVDSQAPTLPASSNAADEMSDRARLQDKWSAPAAPHSFVAPQSSDSLSEEVRLLSKAEQQLNGGHADEALKTLAEDGRCSHAGAHGNAHSILVHPRTRRGSNHRSHKARPRLPSLSLLGGCQRTLRDHRALGRGYTPPSNQNDPSRQQYSASMDRLPSRSHCVVAQRSNTAPEVSRARCAA
jgi:hypothetical protein